MSGSSITSIFSLTKGRIFLHPRLPRNNTSIDSMVRSIHETELGRTASIDKVREMRYTFAGARVGCIPQHEIMREPATETGDSQEVISLEVRVSGRVQGVGFRYFAHEAARRLDLVGYVMNLRTGGVRAYVEGPRWALGEYLRQIEKGPAGSHVREAQSHWGPATGQYSFFSIERTM